MIFHVEVTNVKKETIVQTHGTASVDGVCVCEADLMFAIVDKKEGSA